jgi:hypothetical protein
MVCGHGFLKQSMAFLFLDEGSRLEACGTACVTQALRFEGDDDY